MKATFFWFGRVIRTILYQILKMKKVILEQHHHKRTTNAFVFSIMFIVSCCGTIKDNNFNDRPNVIVVLVDDMGFSDIGCYGSEISTPNIDKLGYDGLRFTQFYNAARCCPSRASLLTGLYPHQAGIGGMVDVKGRVRESGPYQGWLSQNAVTIAEVLKENGYNTYMSGKWHVGEDSLDWPLQRGFEKYFGLISGANSYYEILPGRKVVNQNTLVNSLPEGFYMTHAISDSALSFVKQNSNSNKPFFLYLAYTAPHWPLHAVADKIEKYRGKYLLGWDSIRQERHNRQIQMGLFAQPVNLSPRDSVVPSWIDVENKEEWDLKMAVYAAMIESIDDGIGKLVRHLQESGKLENTVIMFLSDNGACHETLNERMDKDLLEFASKARTTSTGDMGSYVAYGKEWANASNTPFRLYKHWTHEGGISTPLIIHFPQLMKQGKIVHEVSHLVDIFPTVLDLCHAEYPNVFKGNNIQPQEGTSLVPLIANKWTRHKTLYWEHFGSGAIRMGKWKLVSEHKGPWELYNMEVDRSELNDLSATFPDTVVHLEKQYKRWASRVGVKN